MKKINYTKNPQHTYSVLAALTYVSLSTQKNKEGSTIDSVINQTTTSYYWQQVRAHLKRMREQSPTLPCIPY